MARISRRENTLLVTGGAGYIGSVLIRELAQDKHFHDRVIRIYDSLYREHLCGLMDLSEDAAYEFIEGDVLDRLNLLRAMQGADTVFHLAGIVRAPLSFDQPELTRQVNHWGTSMVVDCAIEAGVKKLIYASSASVYGPGGPFGEDDPCRPVGPYAKSKRQGEQVVLEGRKRGLDAVVLRLGTTFGYAPSMRFDAVVSRFAFLAGINRTISVHGNGEQVRPFIHVRDATSAFRWCCTHGSREKPVLNVVALNISINGILEELRQLVPGVATHYTDQDLMSELSIEVDSSAILKQGYTFDHGIADGLREMLGKWKGYSGG